LSPEERYAAIDQGMKDLMFMGKEVKNSWGTIATSDRFIKEQPKVMAGFARAVVKALRFVRQNREGAIAAATKFTELDNALVTRMYDDIAKTFTANGVVDEEAQRNDLAIVREIAGVSEVVPIQRAYDFSFASQADQQLTKDGWRP
jgi:ABC-type nitrate/sulfonate/bicarbonate transport system substrate-binding protein